MRGTLGYLAVGIVALAIAAVAFFPAQTAYRWFAPPGIVLSGISGSIWQGTASEAMVNGAYLRNLKWRAAPLALAKGRFQVDVEARPGAGLLESRISVGATGRVAFTDLQGSLPLETLEKPLGIGGLRGSATLRFDRLALRDGLPVAADGVLTVSDLVLPPVDRASLGGYRAEFFTRDSGITASVEDTDGVVDIAGSFELQADRNYRFLAQLATKPSTPASLRQQLQFLGSPNERGQRELRLEGRL